MMNKNQKMIIAVDGFSSCGKSTLAKDLAKELNYIYIDSGAMYRAVTLFCIEQGILVGNNIDEKRLQKELSNIYIEFKVNAESGISETYLNNILIEDKIREIEVSNSVSYVSKIKFVREFLVEMQQNIGKNKGIVMDGRDIGTVVFPDADIKLFVTADVDIRANRRYKELTLKGSSVSLEEIKKNIEDRDYQDQNREISPLRKADDAITLDNSTMNVQEQLVWVKETLKLN